ncbi:hypothetical protein GGX14DRAFT_677305 [Mycena pura]|uniref:Uncharacterized protein n=1 Tax=Mycena pura TaxID=153505 RepID=A0AAD6UWJ7_9AGAR|nr:hypothetical protein GGX14DRAFT_677305 [Mycena pura]
MFAKVSLAILAAITANFAGAAVVKRAVSPDAPATITACSGSLNPPNGCATIPVVADTCTSFTGGLTFLNNEISNVLVPLGFTCTFFDQFGCDSNGGTGNPSDVVFLQGGATNMENAQGVAGPENFNDLASSFTCSPIYEELTKVIFDVPLCETERSVRLE